VLEKDSIQVNARDLLGILTLDCPQGTRLVLKASGPEAGEAALSLSRLFCPKIWRIMTEANHYLQGIPASPGNCHRASLGIERDG